MKILILHNRYITHGGEETYVNNLINLFKLYKIKHNTFIADSKNISNSYISLLQTSIRLFTNGNISQILNNIILRQSPEIVHFNNIHPLVTPTAYRICKKNNVKIIQTIHNYRNFCPKGVLFRENKVCELCVNKIFPYYSIKYGCYHRSKLASAVFSSSQFWHKLRGSFDLIDYFIFPSKYTRDYYLKNSSININRTKIIPYFTFDTNSNKYLKGTKNENYFLYVGRLSEEKGIKQLVLLFKNIPDIELRIIGEGPLQSELKKNFSFKNIKYLGKLDNLIIKKIMHGAICTIIPSLWYEVLPMVLIESFSCGTPVIVPKFGTFNDLVIEGKTGFFYEQNNFEDLKSKVIHLYKNKNHMQSIRVSARKEYEKKYTPEIHFNQLLKVYKSLL